MRMPIKGFAVLLLTLMASLTWAAALVPQAPKLAASAYILMDAGTGHIIVENNADEVLPPASLTKMMTAYILSYEVATGNVALTDEVRISEKAWRTEGSRMFIQEGKFVLLEDLMRGVIIQSGNDACIVVAEGLAESEEAFAEEMTERAIELGMKNTIFKNATGWPVPGHVSTARDLALLAKRTIMDFPTFYHYYSNKEYTFNGIRQKNRNPLLDRDNISADGLKTGHTQDSGYGLTASAKKGQRRLILVVNGLPTKKARRREPERLLEWGFREFNNYKLFNAGEKVASSDVWLGDRPMVGLVINKELIVTLPRKARRKMKVIVQYDSPIPAPISRGDKVAKLLITAPGELDIEVPLSADRNIAQLSLMGRIGPALRAVIWGDTR